MLKVLTSIDAGQVQEHFGNGILLDARRDLLQGGHQALAEIMVKPVIRTENKHFFGIGLILYLKPGRAHFYTERFCVGAARDDAAVIVSQHDHRSAAQVRAEQRLTAGVKGVDVGQIKRGHDHLRRARVLLKNQVTTPSSCSSCG